jgi:glucokinase
MNPYSIGVDLGGTNLRVAACESGTQFLDVVQLPTRLSDGRACVVQDMSDAIRAIQAKQSSNRSLTGIGVGAPGPLELPEGILRNHRIFTVGMASTYEKPSSPLCALRS